jgi:dihydrofolate reductase
LATIRLYMSMSLDGYVTGPQDSLDNPMGIGGFRLFNWLSERHHPGPNRQVYAEAEATRALISGRRTYEHADRWGGDHHDGVPIFVLTHDVPDDPPPGSVRYVTDVHECAALARAAAGDGEVMVHGAGAAQALLRAGQLDELELHLVPVLLGQGRRLFEQLPVEQAVEHPAEHPAERIELEAVRRLADPHIDDPAQRVTHLRYRVRRP